jgi:hypothetical protein
VDYYIWKDVIVNAIRLLVPAQDVLFYKFIAATISTLIVVVVIYLIANSESEAEYVIRKFKKSKKK